MDIRDEKNPDNDQRCWEALISREVQSAASFFYGVKTTGVFCRPGCKSRLPRRENVEFFASAEEAQNAGYRPCKRCQPHLDDPRREWNAAILKACAVIDQAESPPLLKDLARAVGLSPFHFQRVFKKIVGITPRQYYDEKRAGRLRNTLRSSPTITDAIYDSGFGSNSRFYSQAGERLGMPPSLYKKGAPGLRLRYSIVESHLGWVLIAATERGVCAIEFGESPSDLADVLAKRFPGAQITRDDADFAGWAARITAYIDRPREGLELPLDIQGTAFQRRVWQALKSIPSGSTASYAEIAAKIGNPQAVRAVAQACAANKIALAIPCHRAVRADGSLGGYRWGVARKQKILSLERDSTKAGKK